MHLKAFCNRSLSILRRFTINVPAATKARFSNQIMLAMKLTIVFLTVAFLQVRAIGVSQMISYTGSSVKLETIFIAIEQQTGFAVVSSAALVNKAHPITISAKNMPLKIFLERILMNEPLEFTMEDKTIVISRKIPPSDVNAERKENMLAPPINVQGRVINEDGEPLAGATIGIIGTNLITTTDEKGYYKIDNVSPGDYSVAVSFVGYATKTVSLKVTESNAVTLDFKLNPSLVNLDQLTVTSTLSARKIRAYPATIAVIKQEDLKNRNLNNIANVLEAVPGIILQPGTEGSNSSNFRTPQGILIRGTSAGAPIKYLIDGVDIVSADLGVSILQTLDPNDIEKLEILKGPMASTLYGSGAAGGIISITTKKGKTGKTKVNFKTMFTQYADDYANYNGYNQNYSLNVSGGSEQFNYLLGTGYNLYPLTKLKEMSNGLDDKTWSYNAKVGGRLKNINIDLSLQYGNEKKGAGSSPVSYNKYLVSIGLPPYPIYPLEDVRFFQRNFLTALHLTHTLATNWYQDLTIGYNITNYLQSSYTLSDYTGAYSNYEYLYSKMNARYFMFYDHSWTEAIKSSITAGFEYNGYDVRAMSMNTTTPLTNFFSSSTPASANSASFTKSPYSSTGYFAEVVTGFKDNLFLTTGIRYDVDPAYGDNVGAYAQPRVGLSYVAEFDKFKIKPRVVWGVASTPPSPTYKITTITPYPDYGYTEVMVGNRDIKPQRSEGYELGADIFYGNDYSLNITWYDQRVKDMIQMFQTVDASTNPIIINTYHYNIGEAINRGIEVSAKAVVNSFVLDLSYTQTTSKWGNATGQTPSGTVYPGAPNQGVPKNSFFARLMYKVPSLLKWSNKGGSISLDWRHNGSSFYNNYIGYSLATQDWQNLPDPKPAYPNYDDYYIWQKGYSYFNLRADYSITNFAALYIDIQNLLDKQGSINGQSLAQFPGRRINFGFTIAL